MMFSDGDKVFALLTGLAVGFLMLHLLGPLICKAIAFAGKGTATTRPS